jgi:hypothetical protein
MGDFTYCKGTGCELKETCFRFKWKLKSDREWCFIIPPIENGQCDYYIDVNNGKNLTKTDL